MGEAAIKTHGEHCYDCRDCIEACKRSMDHTCDGPLTPFVIMSRATELAAGKTWSANSCSNALYELLAEFGVLNRCTYGCDDKLDPNEILAESSEH